MLNESKFYEGGSFDVVSSFPELQIMPEGSLNRDDILIYGTSDQTVNPVELLMTALVVEKEGLAKWRFFNYPLNDKWTRNDLTGIFAPYDFPFADNPLEAIHHLGLNGSADKLEHLSLQEAVCIDDEILAMNLGDIVEAIKECRKIHVFNVANIFDSNHPKKIFGSKKNNLYWKRLRHIPLGNLLHSEDVKLGGTVIYFLFGYYSAKNSNVVCLLPHNTRGDVWGAFAAGVKMAKGSSRLYPVGGVDLMTTTQWKMWRETSGWKKAPTWVIERLQNHPFGDTFKKAFLDEKRYCPVAYDENRDRFYFENLS